MGSRHTALIYGVPMDRVLRVALMTSGDEWIWDGVAGVVAPEMGVRLDVMGFVVAVGVDRPHSGDEASIGTLDLARVDETHAAQLSRASRWFIEFTGWLRVAGYRTALNRIGVPRLILVTVERP